MKTKSIS